MRARTNLLALAAVLLLGCGPSKTGPDGPSPASPTPEPTAAPATTGGPAPGAPGAPAGPAPTVDVDKLLADARAALSEGRLDQAERHLLEATGLRPADPAGHYLLGVTSLRQGKLDRAARSLERASDQGAGIDATRLLARVRVRRGDPAAAERLVQQKLAEAPEDLALLALRQWVWVRQGRSREVVDTSRDLLRKDETNVPIMLALADAYIQLNRVELADYILRTAAQLGDDPDVDQARARVAVLKKDQRSALYFLQRAVQLRPDFPEALNNLGVAYITAGDAAAAVDVLARAVSLSPAFAPAQANLGTAYRRTRQYREAEKAYKRALELDDSLAAAHFNLGILYFEDDSGDIPDERRFSQALERFQRYRDLSGATLGKDDPVDKYIAESRTLLDEISRSRSEEPQPMEEPVPDSDGTDDVDVDIETTEPVTDLEELPPDPEAPAPAPTETPDPGSAAPGADESDPAPETPPTTEDVN